MFENIFFNPASLAFTEMLIEATTAVSNISTEAFVQLYADAGRKLLILDVRAPEEYSLSHIRLARQVDPEITTDEFMKRFRHDLEGKTVVLYCSVGQRSSLLLRRIREVCLESGAEDLHNLKGGIFRWYNEGYPVVNSEGETDDIHPFNPLWGLLVKKRGSQG
jgi:rhodanese-related sulfurtransferase